MGNWIPGAMIIHAVKDGGSMLGGNPRVTWHTTENDPARTSAKAVANYLNSTGNTVHVVWNPVTGQIVQMIPTNRAGRGLKNTAGGVETNRKGSVNIQIEVVARAAKPFTQYACRNLDVIVKWLRSLGIKDVFPGGAPKSYPASAGLGNGDRSTVAWAQNGHFGHSQVPENSHGDPGAISVAKILTAGKTITGSPAPAPVNVVKPQIGSTYKVVTGDTLWEISMKFKVTVAALKAANGLKNDLLRVGQILKIPAKPVAITSRIAVANCQYGKMNTDVRMMQTQLRRVVGLATVDGDFGPLTKAAVVRMQAKMGIAVLVDQENCLNVLGLRCDVCYRVCPAIDKAIRLEQRHNPRSDRHALLIPTVQSEFCTGCGKCEKACVLEDAAIKVLPTRLARGRLGAHYRKGWEEKSRAGGSLIPPQVELPVRGLEPQR